MLLERDTLSQEKGEGKRGKAVPAELLKRK
jgi:hypothetical protein